MIQKAYLGKHAVVPLPYQSRIQRRNALALGAAATALGIAIAATPGAAFAATEVNFSEEDATNVFYVGGDNTEVDGGFNIADVTNGNVIYSFKNYAYVGEDNPVDYVPLSTQWRKASYIVVGSSDKGEIRLYGDWLATWDASNKAYYYKLAEENEGTPLSKEFSKIALDAATSGTYSIGALNIVGDIIIDADGTVKVANTDGDAINITNAGKVEFQGSGTLNIAATEGDGIAIRSDKTITLTSGTNTGLVVKTTSEKYDVAAIYVETKGGANVTLAGKTDLSANNTNIADNQIAAGLNVQAEGAANVTSSEFLKASANSAGSAYGVLVNAATADVKVADGANVSAIGVNVAHGLEVISNTAEATVTVGPATPQTVLNETELAEIELSEKVKKANISASASSNKAAGIYVKSAADATVIFNEITELGATGKEAARGLLVEAAGDATVANNSKLTANATSDNDAVAVKIKSDEDVTAAFKANATLDAYGVKGAQGLGISAGQGTVDVRNVDKTQLTVNATASSENGNAYGIYIAAGKNKTVGEDTIKAAVIDIPGKAYITAKGGYTSTGVLISAGQGSADVSSIGGLLDIQAGYAEDEDAQNANATGIWINADNAEANFSVRTDVVARATDVAEAVTIMTRNGTTVTTGNPRPVVAETSDIEETGATFKGYATGENGKAAGIYITSAKGDVVAEFNKKTTLVAEGQAYARGLRVKAENGVVNVSNNKLLNVTAKALGENGDADAIYITAGDDKVIDGATPATIKAVELDFNNEATIAANGTASAHGIHVKAAGSADIANSAPIAVKADSQKEAVGILVDVKGAANIDSDKPIVLDVNVDGHGVDENKTTAKGISVTSVNDAILDIDGTNAENPWVVNVNNQVPTGGFIDAKAGSDEATGIELTSTTGKAKLNAVDASTVNVTVLGYENAYGVRLYAKEGKDLDKNDAVFTIGDGAVVTVNAYSTDIRSNQSMPEPYSKKDLTVFGNSMGVDVHADRNAIVNIATAGVLNVSTGVVGADGLDLPGGRDGGPTEEHRDDLKLAYGDPYKGNSTTVGIHVKSEKNDASLYVSDKDYMTGEENQSLKETDSAHSALNVKGAANNATGIFVEAGPEGDNAVMLVRDDATVTVTEAGATTLGTYLKAEDRTQYTVNDANVSYKNYAGNVKAQGIVLESAEWQAQATIANGSVVSIDIQALTAETRNSVKFANVAEGIVVQSHEGGDLGTLDDDNHNAKLNVKASQLNIAIGDAEGFQVASKEANGINVFSDGYNALVNFDQVIGDINMIARDEINVIDVESSTSDKNKLPEGNKAEVFIQDSNLDVDLATSITSDQRTDAIDVIDAGGSQNDDAAVVVLGDTFIDIEAQGVDIEAIEVQAQRNAEVIIDGSKYVDEHGQIVDATAANGHKDLGVLINTDLNATGSIAGIQVNSNGTNTDGDATLVIKDAVVTIDEEGAIDFDQTRRPLDEGTAIVVESQDGKAGAFIDDADVHINIDAKDKAEVVTIAGDEAGALIVNNADIELEAEAAEVKAGIAVSGDNVFVVTNDTDIDIEVTDKNVETEKPNGTVGIDIETNADAGEKAGNVIAVFTDTNMDIEVTNNYKAQGIDVDANNNATVKIVDKDKDATDPDLIFIDAEGQGKNKGINIDAAQGNATVVLDADVIDIDVNGGEDAQGKDTAAGKGTGIEVKADKNASVEIDAELTVNVIAQNAEDGIEVIAVKGNADVKANKSDLEIKVIDTKAEAELEDKNTSEGIDVYGGGYASVVLKDTDVDITVANKVNAKDVVIRATGLPQQSTTAEVQTSETTDFSDTSVPAAPIKREVANGNAEFIVVNTGKNGVFDIDVISDNGVGIDVSGANDATVVISAADTNIDVYGLDEKLQKAPAAGVAEGIGVAAGSKEAGKTSEAINGGNASVTIFNSDADINVIAQNNARGIGVFSLEGNASAKTDNSELTINALGKEAIEGENEAVGINVSSFGTNKSASVQLINTETEITAKRGLGAKDIAVTSYQGSAEVIVSDKTAHSKLDLDAQSANAAANIDVNGYMGANVVIDGVNTVDLTAGEGSNDPTKLANKASVITADTVYGNANVKVNDVDKLNIGVAAKTIEGVIVADATNEDTLGATGALFGNANVTISDVDDAFIGVYGGEAQDIITALSHEKNLAQKELVAEVAIDDVKGDIVVVADDVYNGIYASGGVAKATINASDLDVRLTDLVSEGEGHNKYATDGIDVRGKYYAEAVVTDSDLDIKASNKDAAHGIIAVAADGYAKVVAANMDGEGEEAVTIDVEAANTKGIYAGGKTGADVFVNGVDVDIEANAGQGWFGMDIPGQKATGIWAEATDNGNAGVWVNDAEVAIDLDAATVAGAILADAKGADKDANVKLTNVALDIDVNASNEAKNVITAKSADDSTVWLEKVTGEIDVVAGDVENVIFAKGENASVLSNKTQLDIDVIDTNNAAGHKNATDVIEVSGGQSAKAILTDTGFDIDATNQHSASGVKVTTNDNVNSNTQSAMFIAQDLDSKIADKIDIRLNTQDGTGIKVKSDDFASASINKTTVDIDVDGGNFMWFEAPATNAAGILVQTIDIDQIDKNTELTGTASLIVQNADVDVNLNATQVEAGIGVIGQNAGMLATDSDITVIADDKNVVKSGNSVSVGIAVAGQNNNLVAVDLFDTNVKVDLDNEQFALGIGAVNAGQGDASVNIHGKDSKNSTVVVDANAELAAIGVVAGTLQGDASVQFDETNATVIADGDVAAIGVAAVGKTTSDVTIDDGSNVTVKAISSGIVTEEEIKKAIPSDWSTAQGFASTIQQRAGVAVGIADVAYKGAGEGEGVASFTVDEQSTANVTTYGRTLAAGVAVAGEKHVDVDVVDGSKLFVDADSSVDPKIGLGQTVGILEGVWDGQATLTIDEASAVGVDAKGAGVVYGVAAEINTAQGLPEGANAVDIQIKGDSILKSEATSSLGKSAGVDVQIGLRGLAGDLEAATGLPILSDFLKDELAPLTDTPVEGNVNIDIDDSTFIATATADVYAQGFNAQVHGEGDIDVDITKNSHVYASGYSVESASSTELPEGSYNIGEGINIGTAVGNVDFDVIGSSDVHVKGEAAKSTDTDYAYGIHLKAGEADGDKTGNNGNVNAGVAFGSTLEASGKGEIAKGINIEAKSNANLGVNVASSVTADAKGKTATGIVIKAYDEDHETTEGANVAVNFGSSVTATATADGSAESGRDAKGIDIIAGDNITSMVGFGSTVTATGNAGDEGHGIEMRAEKIDLDVVANSKVVATANAGDDALAFEAITLGQTDAINLDVNVAGNSSIIGTANAGKDAYGVDFDVTAGKANIDVAGNSKIVGIANAGVDAIGIDVDAPVAIDIDVTDNSSVKGVANATFPGTGNNAIGIDVDSADVDITVDGKSSVGAVANANKTARAIDIDAIAKNTGTIDIDVLGESLIDADANGAFAEAIGVQADLAIEIDVKGESKVFATANGVTGAEGIDINVINVLAGSSLSGYDPNASINIDVDGESLVDADANAFGSAKAIEITSEKEGIDVDVTGASKVDADANGATAYAIGIEAKNVNADVVGFSTVEATANGFNRAEGIDIDAEKYAGIGVAGGSKVDADANSFGAAYAIHVDVDEGKLEAGVTASTVEANANGKTADALVLNGDEDVNVGFFAGSVVDVEANGYSEAEGITLNSEKGAVNLTVAGSQVYVDNKTVAGDKNTGIHVTSASKSDVDVAYSNIEVGISDQGADRTWIEGVYVASYHGPASIDTLMSNVEVDIDAVGNADEAVGISAHGISANVTADQSTLIADIDFDGKEVKSGDTTYDVIGLGIVAEAANDANVIINDDSTVIANVNNKQKSGDTYGIAVASINEDAKVLVLDGSEVTADVDGYDADGILALTADGDAFVVVSGSKATATADGVDSGTAISAHSKAGNSWVRINNGDVTATSSADGRTTAAIVSWSENKTEATNSKLEIINDSKVTATATEAKSATGIGTYSVKGNAETIIENSDVTSTADGINYAWAINANATDGRSDLTITNSQVNATASAAEVAAINAKASDKAVGDITNSNVTATATGEGNKKAYAINIDGKEGSYLDIDDSEVTATATNTAGAADHKYTIGINVESDEGVADFDLTDSDVEASANGYKATGISVDAAKNSALVIEDSGVTASGTGNGFAEGIWVDSKKENASITIDGSVVRAEGTSDGDARGMIAVAAKTGTIDISNKSIVVGEATSSAGNAAGIEVEATNGGVSISGIANDTYVTGKGTAQAGFATGILVDNESIDGYDVQAGGDLYVRANISNVNAIADGNVARGILVNSVYGENQADEAVVNFKGTWYGVEANGNKSASGIYANGEEATVEAEHSNGTVTAKANGLAYGVGVKADNTGEINIIGDKTGQNVLWHGINVTAESVNGKAAAFNVNAQDGGVNITDYAYAGLNATSQNGEAAGIDVNNNSAAKGGDLYVNIKNSTLWDTANGYKAAGIDVNLGTDYVANTADVNIIGSEVSITANGQTNSRGIGAKGNYVDINIINSNTGILADPTVAGGKAIGVAAQGYYDADVLVEGGAGFNCYAIAPTEAIGILSDAAHGNATLEIKDIDGFDVRGASCDVNIGVEVHAGFGDASLTFDNATGKLMGDGYGGSDYSIAALTLVDEAPTTDFIYFENGSKLPSWEDVQVYNPAGPAHGRVIGYGDGQITSLDSWEVVDEVDITK